MERHFEEGLNKLDGSVTCGIERRSDTVKMRTEINGSFAHKQN
jgi:hypothetical protein